jgi:hypothetical protein
MCSVQLEPQIDYSECTIDESWALKRRDDFESKLYPNPARAGQLVRVQKKGLVDIVDASGRSVLSSFTKLENETTFELSKKLSPGCYYVHFDHGATPLVILP